MMACSNGHIAIARMLVGEYNANVDILDTVLLLLFYSADTLVSVCSCISTSLIGSSNCVNNLLGLER